MAFLPSNVPDNNHAFDDERGDYISQAHDHIGYRFEILGHLGKGSFGCVLKCYDHKSKSLRAVKIIRNKKRFKQQGMVEITILDNLRRKDYKDQKNIVRMMQSFWFRNHLCLSQELLATNLYELINKTQFQGLPLTLIKKFAYQIAQALEFLHGQQIIHCDLKPENVMLRTKDKVKLKVIDFGSSCYIDQRVYTYIQSRFYRAPEVILGIPYNQAIDMWSFGCIVAELFTGYPIFPGESEQEQLQCIMEVIGVPPMSQVAKSTRKKLFFTPNNQPIVTPNSRGKVRKPGSKPLPRALKTHDKYLISFLQHCLKWRASERITPTQALNHPFLTNQGENGDIAKELSPQEKELLNTQYGKMRDLQHSSMLKSQQQHQQQHGNNGYTKSSMNYGKDLNYGNLQPVLQRPYSGTVSEFSIQDTVFRQNNSAMQHQQNGMLMQQPSIMSNYQNNAQFINQQYQPQIDGSMNPTQSRNQYRQQPTNILNSMQNPGYDYK